MFEEVDEEYGVRETDGWVNNLALCLGTLRQFQGPELKSIRLLDFHGNSWKDHPWRPSQAWSFQYWIDTWIKGGVRLENSDGDPMEVPPYIDYDAWTGKRTEIPRDAWVLYQHGEESGEGSGSEG
jgi:hypothetical protein